MGGSRETTLLPGLLSVALFFFSLNFIGTVLARYSRDLGISIAATGVIWSAVSLVSFVMRPFSGYLADKLHSYVSMSIGGFFMVLAAIVYAYSHGFSGLMGGRVVQGLAIGFFIAPSIAVVAMAAGSYAGMALGYRSMIIALSSLVAPPIAGIMADAMGYKAVFAASGILAAALALVDGILARRIRMTRREHRKVEWRKALNRVVILAALAAVMGGSGFFAISMLVQSHYRDLGYSASIYGYFMMFTGLSGLFSRYLGGRFSMTRNPAVLAIIGYAVAAVSMIMLGSMYLIPGAYIVALTYGFGLGLTVPSQQLLVLDAVEPQVKNTAASIYAMGFDLGGFIGPLAYGYAASLRGYVEAYYLLALSFILAVAPLIIVAYYIGRGDLYSRPPRWNR